MAVRTYQLALAAGAKRLSDVYGGPPGVADPKTDIPYRELVLQVGGAIAALGGDNQVTASVFGYQFQINGALTLGPFEAGPVKLSDLWLIGAGATISIVGVPY